MTLTCSWIRELLVFCYYIKSHSNLFSFKFGSLNFHIHFRINLSTSTEVLLTFWLPVHWFGENWHHFKLSSGPWTSYSHPVVQFSFYNCFFVDFLHFLFRLILNYLIFFPVSLWMLSFKAFILFFVVCWVIRTLSLDFLNILFTHSYFCEYQ